MNIEVVKKNGTSEDFSFEKIFSAVNKSAKRVGVELPESKWDELFSNVSKSVSGKKIVDVTNLHQIVENSLSKVDIDVANSYCGYRNYKKEMAEMMEEVVGEVDKSLEERDRSNSNGNSKLFASRRTNVSKILLAKMFEKYFLTEEQRQATKDGYIYVNDKDNRLIGTHNCCVVNMGNIMDGGFNINGFFCKEPKDITNAVGVLGDLIVTCASAQYGGFSVANIDKTLEKYCIKSEMIWRDRFKSMGVENFIVPAVEMVEQELENALQALEFQLNTRESARGDYPFVTFSFGYERGYWAKRVSKAILNVRMKGHGDRIKQKVIFPKLVMRLRDDRLNDDIFDLAVKCSSVALYPDYIPEEKASPMGCRSFLPDMFLDDGSNLLEGRGNVGVVTLNLPMIYMKSVKEDIPFLDVLDYYLEMVRDINYRTYDLIGKQKAGSNPIMFCEGGFYGGNLKEDDVIAPIVNKTFTASFGITALNELSVLATGCSLREDRTFAALTMKHIQAKIDEFKDEDDRLYSIYGTPAESLAGRQVKQFRKKYGIIEGVSDREYFSNSFHLHVSEDITPFQKQDMEKELFDIHSGGHIQYVRINNPSNLSGIKMLVERGVYHHRLYQGVNINACTCLKCGHEGDSFNGSCPKCGSFEYNEFNRICGYLGFTKKNGDYTINDEKISEIVDRISM